jgi:hypothetical protein
MTVQVFGIRHHGPGSARSLLAALSELRPDCLLVEGPPDAQGILPLLRHPEMRPPVALLIYAPAALQKAAFFPFALFSPEWQALQYGLEQGIPVRLIDLPQAHALAATPMAEESDEPPTPTTPGLPFDPLERLAEAAGYEDGESWWEEMVEQRLGGVELFAAILEVMAELRQELEPLNPPDTFLREAYMRRCIRAAEQQGFRRPAVVCGAWHAPALTAEALADAGADERLLKGIEKQQVAVTATWIPWTNGRLARASGYGAGINSPGWYLHLWQSQAAPAVGWLSRVAHLLRQEDLSASPAQVIDAVRLAETLSIMRRRAAPGLVELNEATRAVFCFGDPAMPELALIHRKLIVGESIGRVPDSTPMVPLQRDLQQEQQRLRMAVMAEPTVLSLDLRKPLHLERSHLLHRLELLGIGWGQPESVRQQGTFREVWRLVWQPELTIRLIEQSAWGNTVRLAAAGYAQHLAQTSEALALLASLAQRVLLAELPEATPAVVHRLQERAALTGDVTLLMQSLPPLAEVLRYGSVRRADAEAIRAVVKGMVERVLIGLPLACASLADEAAGELFGHLVAFQRVIQLLDNAEQSQQWEMVLGRLVEQDGVHGLIRGRAARMLLDVGRLPPAEAVRQLRLAINQVIEPAQAAAWLDGFLRNSGQVLLHHDRLLQVIDEWLGGLDGVDFLALLPLLRRTFATLSAPERRQIGQLLVRWRQAARAAPTQTAGGQGLDEARANAVLPILAELLGVANPLAHKE